MSYTWEMMYVFTQPLNNEQDITWGQFFAEFNFKVFRFLEQLLYECSDLNSGCHVYLLGQ